MNLAVNEHRYRMAINALINARIAQVKFHEAPCTVRYLVPELGAHTTGVLQALGYSAPEITTLSQGS